MPRLILWKECSQITRPVQHPQNPNTPAGGEIEDEKLSETSYRPESQLRELGDTLATGTMLGIVANVLNASRAASRNRSAEDGLSNPIYAAISSKSRRACGVFVATPFMMLSTRGVRQFAAVHRSSVS